MHPGELGAGGLLGGWGVCLPGLRFLVSRQGCMSDATFPIVRLFLILHRVHPCQNGQMMVRPQKLRAFQL